MRVCDCGHVEDDHGHDPKHPGSTACRMGSDGLNDADPLLDGYDCDCCCFSWDEEEES